MAPTQPVPPQRTSAELDGTGVVRGRPCWPVHRLEHQVAKQERHVENRVAKMGDFEVDDPEVRAGPTKTFLGEKSRVPSTTGDPSSRTRNRARRRRSRAVAGPPCGNTGRRVMPRSAPSGGDGRKARSRARWRRATGPAGEPSRTATPLSIVPASNNDFQFCQQAGARSTTSAERSRSRSRTAGAAPGVNAPTRSSASASAMARSRGAGQSSATRRRANACLTTTAPGPSPRPARCWILRPREVGLGPRGPGEALETRGNREHCPRQGCGCRRRPQRAYLSYRVGKLIPLTAEERYSLIAPGRPTTKR